MEKRSASMETFGSAHAPTAPARETASGTGSNECDSNKRATAEEQVVSEPINFNGSLEVASDEQNDDDGVSHVSVKHQPPLHEVLLVDHDDESIVSTLSATSRGTSSSSTSRLAATAASTGISPRVGAFATRHSRRDLLDHTQGRRQPQQAKHAYNAQVAATMATAKAPSRHRPCHDKDCGDHTRSTMVAAPVPHRPCHLKSMIAATGTIPQSPPKRPCHEKLQSITRTSTVVETATATTNSAVMANLESHRSGRRSTPHESSNPSHATGYNSSLNVSSTPAELTCQGAQHDGGATVAADSIGDTEVLAVARAVVVVPPPSLLYGDCFSPPTTASTAASTAAVTVEEKRALFRHQVRRDMLAKAVRAEPVEQAVTTVNGNHASIGDGGDDTANACFDIYSRRRRGASIGFALLLFAIAIAAVVSLSLYWFQPNDKDGSIDHQAAQSSLFTPSMAPQVSLEPTILNADGRLAFTSTPQLYQAVDAYIQAIGSDDQANANTASNSTVALQYGFPIGAWDVSRLTDFSRVFSSNRGQTLDTSDRMESLFAAFNEDLSGWNVSNAITMYGMFAGASAFVGMGLEHWDTSRVVDLSFTFFYAQAFTGNISVWNTSSATKMMATFSHAISFNGDVSQWNTAKVDSTASMFAYATSFSGGDLSMWNVGRVRDMSYMLCEAFAFTGNVSTWDVGAVENMEAMFFDCKEFNGDLKYWDVGRVQNMGYMFEDAAKFSGGDLSMWNVRNVRDMRYMFCDALAFTGSVSTWDVGAVENMEAMFANCKLFNGDLKQWDVGRVQTMRYMFEEALSFQGTGLSAWNTGRVRTLARTFAYSAAFDADLANWNVSQVSDLSSTFLFATSFSSNLSSWDVGNVVDMTETFADTAAFNSDLSSWNVDRVKYLSYMFAGAQAFNHNLCAWGPRLQGRNNVVTNDMFANATSCPTLQDPTLGANRSGPFCYLCDP